MIEHKQCNKCKHSKIVYADKGCSFTGCFHKPYNGIWIRMIKKCPGAALIKEEKSLQIFLLRRLLDKL